MYERLTAKIDHLETEIAKKEQTATNTKNEEEQLLLKQQMDQMNKELKALKEDLEILKTEHKDQLDSITEKVDTAMDRAMSAKAASRKTQKRQDIKVETVTQDMETLSRKHKALEERVSVSEAASEDRKCKCQEKCTQAMQAMIEQTIQKQMANNKDECRQAMKGMIEETIQQQMADNSGQLERQVSTAVESAMNKHTQHTNGEIEELKKHIKQEMKTLMIAQKRDIVRSIQSGSTLEQITPPTDRQPRNLARTRSQPIRETRPPSEPPFDSFLRTRQIPHPAARQTQSSMGSRFPESQEHEKGEP